MRLKRIGVRSLGRSFKSLQEETEVVKAEVSEAEVAETDVAKPEIPEAEVGS